MFVSVNYGLYIPRLEWGYKRASMLVPFKRKNLEYMCIIEFFFLNSFMTFVMFFRCECRDNEDEADVVLDKANNHRNV